MKEFKTYLMLTIFTASISGQVAWNEPPDTIWYENGQRWVEVILPTPQNLLGSTVNNNQVKLTWNEYWTQTLLDAYINKFGYAAIPNRFSLYKQNLTDGGTLDALTGVDWDKTEYIDINVELDKEYLYKIIASDLNYQTYGGLQRWSQRTVPAIVTVGAPPQSSLHYPTNFTGQYKPSPPMILLNWDYVSGASLYTIFKSYYNPETSNWNYFAIPLGNIDQVNESDIQQDSEYLYSIIAIHGSESSNRAPTIAVTSGALDFNTPNNFSGYYEPDSAMIILTWDYVNDATSYIIFKSYVDPTSKNWVHLTIPIENVNSYLDSELLPWVGYVYTIIAVNGNIKSDRTTPLAINSGTLSIEDEEYWEAVEQYEKDRKIGWFGCSRNK